MSVAGRFRRRAPPLSRPNLLIVGASGNVARAFLRRLPAQRHRFGNVLLVDQTAALLEDRFLDLRRLDARFLHRRLDPRARPGEIRRLIRSERIDVLLDAAGLDTIPMLSICDEARVGYLNTCLNDETRDIDVLVEELTRKPGPVRRAAHILCAGMNPGVVNHWVARGVRRHGVPNEVVHFEYDSSAPAGPWRPTITWSKREFLAETVWTPSGRVVGRRVEPLLPNGLCHPVDMRPILSPIRRMDRYPRGFTILHEENLTIGRRFGIPSRFIYAIDPRTMEHLVRIYRRLGTVRLADLQVADNVRAPLRGTDLVGVYLEYDRRRVYYVNEMPNAAVVGANATCTQVAIGIYCALFTWMYDRLDPGIYFVGDLTRSSYGRHLFRNMRVQEFVFRRFNRRLRLERETSMLPPARNLPGRSILL